VLLNGKNCVGVSDVGNEGSSACTGNSKGIWTCSVVVLAEWKVGKSKFVH